MLSMIDRRMRGSGCGANIEEALKSIGDTFNIRVCAVRLVETDMKDGEDCRLGMARIAWLLGASERSVRSWWDAYENGGIEALRGGGGRPGRRPEAGPDAPGGAAGGAGRRRDAGGGKGKAGWGGGGRAGGRAHGKEREGLQGRPGQAA